jgi:hypothetical protein
MDTWDICRAGHAWGGEAMSRYEMTPEKTEMIAGKLYGTEEERLTMLALLLENVGDKAVRIGNPDIWRAAVDGLSDEREGQQHEPSASLLPEAERRALEAALLSTARAQHEALKQLLDASSDHSGSRILFTASIIKGSKSSGFSSGSIPSFSGLVVFFLAVRCIHGFSRLFDAEPARSSQHLTTIAGPS